MGGSVRFVFRVGHPVSGWRLLDFSRVCNLFEGSLLFRETCSFVFKFGQPLSGFVLLRETKRSTEAFSSFFWGGGRKKDHPYPCLT